MGNKGGKPRPASEAAEPAAAVRDEDAPPPLCAADSAGLGDAAISLRRCGVACVRVDDAAAGGGGAPAHRARRRASERQVREGERRATRPRARVANEAAGAGETADAARCLMSIGGAHGFQGDIPGALEHFQRALAKYEAAGAGETPGAATCLMSIGTVHRMQDDFPRALEHFQRALAKFEAAGAGETPDAAICREFLTG